MFYENLMQFLAIVSGTFVSEDLTCITTGVLIHEKKVPILIGLSACFTGILVGDVFLWLMGRIFGRKALKWRFVKFIIQDHHVEKMEIWFNKYGSLAVLISRFVPGTRFATYITAGILGKNAWKFMFWALLAGVLWTPFLVLSTAMLGPVVVEPLKEFLGGGYLTLLLALVIIFLAIKIFEYLLTHSGRNKLKYKIFRISGHEFWPAWIFYIPLVPYLIYLSFKFKGINTITAANPALPHGGIVGESKAEILNLLPSSVIMPYFLAKEDTLENRFSNFIKYFNELHFQYPLIMKPDAAQRGCGFRFIQNEENAQRVLEEIPSDLVIQAYHPGPCEAGIFFCRYPEKDKGHIFSITVKEFPVITGDGENTFEDLLMENMRFRAQSKRLLERHHNIRNKILEKGEKVALVRAGNHSQGAIFKDGSYLITEELEEAFNRIMQNVRGINFGRFDVRFTSEELFKQGKDFAVIELNGVSSESTNIYDPSMNVMKAWKILFLQWRTLFEIGYANRMNGVPVSTKKEMFRDIKAYYKKNKIPKISD